MWAIGIRLFHIHLPWVLLAKVAFISTVAALTAHFVALMFAPLWGVLIGGSASLAVLLALFYLLRVLEPEDQARFNLLTRSMPKSIGGPVEIVLSFMIRPRLAAVTATNV
jgi:hypothetical protein